ncbi:MAG: hypothetical protein Q7U52_11700 [Hydrogenophaga sp.]|nr:hypothetical protein [Hydrogenophaga sp.]
MTLCRTCGTCKHWKADGVPAWAADMALAFCSLKNTRAVTLANWNHCTSFAPAQPDEVAKRVRWMARRGVVPRVVEAS